MLGDMHADIGNDISGNQNFLYLGTSKISKTYRFRYLMS